MCVKTILLMGVVGLALSLSGRAAELKVGAEVTAIVPGAGKRIVVRLPVDYDAARSWPLVFHFHAAGGEPNTTLLQQHRVGDHSILVGMSYLERRKTNNTVEPYADYFAREYQHFRATLAWLLKRAAIDRRRIYLTGISKGGWHVADLAEREAANIAGAAILLAGRHPVRQVGAVPPAIRRMPIYIGVGDKDANVVGALRAKLAYVQAGAHVTLDIYEGLGHQYPVQIPRLEAWFDAQQQVRNRAVSEETRKKLTSDCQTLYEAALAADPVSEQYRQLRTLADDPRLPWCGDRVSRGIWRKVRELGGLPDAGLEWTTEEALLKVIAIETRLKSLSDYKEIVYRLDGICKLPDQTQYGRIAAFLIKPYQDAYDRSLAATQRARTEAAAQRPPPPQKTVSPFQPMTSSRDTPTRIIRTGNKTRFERD